MMYKAVQDESANAGWKEPELHLSWTIPETGTIKPGKVITFAPNKLTIEVNSVEVHHDEANAVWDCLGWGCHALRVRQCWMRPPMLDKAVQYKATKPPVLYEVVHDEAAILD